MLVLMSSESSGQQAANRRPFEPASTVEETRHQHDALRTDDIWWVTNGKDQAWNFKNLHQLFPTVNVYRDGPVRELPYNLMEAIDTYPVDTQGGQLPYRDFLDSEYSTTMGVVIVHRGAIVFEYYPRMKEYQKTVVWSVTKVFVSALVA